MTNSNIISILKESTLPIIIYGTGDGADKLLSYLDLNKIACTAFIVSDDFYRGQIFKGYKCYTVSMANEIFGDYICLIAFGTRLESVISNIVSLSKSHQVFMPPMPLFGDDIFDIDYYTKNKNDIDKARMLFDDAKSKNVYDEIISYRLTGDISHLLKIMDDNSQFDYFKNDFDSFIDLGAYRGDTLSEALIHYPSISKAVCFEPAHKPFTKLEEYTSTLENIQVSLYQKGAWDKDETISFSDGGGRGSHINDKTFVSLSGAKERTVAMTKLDNVYTGKNEKLLIKYDVEGCEEKALIGSYNTIVNNHTSLIVSLYHRACDIFMIPLLLKEMFPNSKMNIRKLYGLPDWDIMLYVEI